MSEFTRKYTFEQLLEAGKKSGLIINERDEEALKAYYEFEHKRTYGIFDHIFERILKNQYWYNDNRDGLINNFHDSVFNSNIKGLINEDQKNMLLQIKFDSHTQKSMDELYTKMYGKERPISNYEYYSIMQRNRKNPNKTQEQLEKEEEERKKEENRLAYEASSKKQVQGIRDALKLDDEAIAPEEDKVPVYVDRARGKDEKDPVKDTEGRKIAEGLVNTEREKINSAPVQQPIQPYVDNATTAQKIARLDAIYNQQISIEDKLKFFVYAYTHNQIDRMNGVNADEELQKINSIKDNFTENYIVNSDESTRKEVYKALGRISGEIDLSIYNEYREELNEIPTDDPHREKKAYYMTAKSSEAGTYLYSLNGNVLQGLIMAFSDSPKVRQDAKALYTIDENTTMEEYAKVSGHETPEAISSFCEDLHAQPTDKAIDIWRRKSEADNIHFNSNKEIIDLMYTDSVFARPNSWRMSGKLELINRGDYNKYQRENIDKISILNGKEASDNGIREWTESQEIQNKIEIQANRNETKASNFFLNNYVKPFEDEKRLKAESEARKRHSIKEDYPEIFEYDEEEEIYVDNTLTTEQAKNIRRDFSYDLAKDSLDRLSSQMHILGAHENREKLKRGWGCTRLDSWLGVFDIWAVGAHPEIKLEDFTTLSERPALVEEFVKFCDDNPVGAPANKEEYENSVKVWAEALKRGTDRVKQIKIPKVDYSDPVKMKENMLMQIKLRSMYINFSQEKDHIFGKQFNIDGKKLAAEHLGENNYDDMLNFWGALQNFSASVDYAYIKVPEYNKPTSTESIVEDAYKTSVSRSLAVSILNHAGGKNLSDALKDFGSKKYYFNNLVNELSDMYDNGEVKPEYSNISNITRKEALDYLKGKNKKDFDKKINKIVSALTPKFKNDFVLYDTVNSVMNLRRTVTFGDAREKLVNLPDVAEATVDFLKSDQKIMNAHGFEGGVLPEQWLSVNMNKIFGENYTMLIKGAGYKQTDMILIDGKTPEEIWGEKYEKYDKYTREDCYKIEFFKKVCEGNSEISFKNVAIGKDGNLKVNGSICVMKSSKQMQETKENFAIYESGAKKIHDELKLLQDALLTTHENKDLNVAREEIGQVGSSLYKKMESTLDAAIKALGNDNLNFTQIENKLKDFKEASSEYYKNRKSMFEKRTPEGKLRLDTSEKAKLDMPDILTNYQELIRGVSSDLRVNDDYTFANASVKSIKLSLESLENNTELRDSMRLGDVTMTEEMASEYADVVREKSHERVIIKDIIAKGLDGLDKNYKSMIKNYKEKSNPDPYEMAVLYKINAYLEKMDEGSTTVNDLKGMEKELKKSFEDGSFKKDAQNLSKNPVFKATLSYNKANFHKEWAQIEKKTESYIYEMKRSLNEIHNEDVDVSKYILTGVLEGKAIPKGEEALKQQYNRLGSFVARDILVDPNQRVIVQAITSGRMEFKEIVKQTTEELKRKGVLEGRNFSVGELRDKISSGTLKSEVVENIKKQASQNAKSRTPIKNTAKAKKSLDVPRR